MKAIILILATTLLMGCKINPNEEDEKRIKAHRIELFKMCMESLPAGPQETKYNDWAEVVSECGSQAYYMSR